MFDGPAWASERTARGSILGGLAFFPTGPTVGNALGDLDSRPATLVGHQVPDPPATGGSEQPRLALARPAAQVHQHGLRVGRGQPLGFGSRADLRGVPTA
jgi:hypothetical protein